MYIERTATTINGVCMYYIFHRNKKRLLVMVVMVTLLAMLFYSHALSVSPSMFQPARRKYSDCATRKLNPHSNDTAANGTIAYDVTSHVLLYDYALEKTFLPSWFFNVSMAELTARLRVKQRSEVAPSSSYVNVSSKNSDANWAVFQRHIKDSSLYDHDDPAVDGLLHDMATMPIVAIEKIGSGTRLKLSVKFIDGGWAVMKVLDKRHVHVDTQGRGERPSCEIAAFHLDRVLDLCRVPPTVGRRVNIWSELASKVLKIQDMYINITEDGRVCFGRTFQIPREACGEPDLVDASLQHQLRAGNQQLLRGRINPWGYKHPDNLMLDLRQHTEQMCAVARTVFNSSAGFDPRRQILVDTLDAAYFDMLIDNWDRHHFGYLTKKKYLQILFDNGKGFHDPSLDYVLCELLYERGGCCLMKKTTFFKFLKLFQGPQRLSDLMRESLGADPLAPVLSNDHILSLDRRLNKIMSFIKDCFKEHGVTGVLLDDLNLV